MRFSFAPVALTLAVFATSRALGDEATPLAPKHFITRTGDQLMDGDKPFRFISFNIPNLQLVEDNFAPGAESPWLWPDEFELKDALESVRQMGGTVVRTYVLSVRREGADIGDHVYVRAPGDFNEDAFRTLDLALDVARAKGIRLVIPLVDNWKWQGGRGEYAAFRGKTAADFWSDEQVIGDFEKTVRFVLSRVNSHSGVPYKDDPAVLAWETGNELDATPAWTKRIAALIKSIDHNHLVADGRSLHGVSPESLEDPNIDIVSTHHYPNVYEAKFVPPILEAKKKSAGKKAYMVGEFGFCPIAEVERVYDAVLKNDVSGALLWSLRFHRRDGGFYWHFEPAGGEKYKAYHWPGFDSGQGYEERAVLDLTRKKAFEIRGLKLPAIQPPAAPVLLPIDDAAAISWQGSAGAHDYAVERAYVPNSKGTQTWEPVGQDVDDSAVQYRALFNDESARAGQAYYYRVIARNSAGVSKPSNIVGPVKVTHSTLVDECADLAKTTAKVGDPHATTGKDRRRREDVGRIALPAGSGVVYELKEPIASWSAIAFRDGDGDKLKLEAAYSSDGKTFAPWAIKQTESAKGAGDYDYLPVINASSDEVPPAVRFLRLQAVGPDDAKDPPGAIELARVEIRYGGD